MERHQRCLAPPKSKANLPKTGFSSFIYFKFLKTVDFATLPPILSAFQISSNLATKEKCDGIIVF